MVFGILVISCIHNDLESILNYFDKISELKFDVVVCPGDFTDIPPKGFSQTALGKLALEELKLFGKPILAVPGSWDKELLPELELAKVSMHGKGRVIGDVGFFGYGGAKTPFNLPLEPSEEELKRGLESAYKQVVDTQIKIMVTHAPPARTSLDRISSGAHVGSETVREFIEKMRPDAAVCAHIHEARGVDVVDNTKVINAGRFPEGYCGFLTVDSGKIEAKILNLT
jgi:Icc-related predicted phosphoesterase